jgi:deazaflavin-dependent oxidoreductase (nitroreductase family)
MTDYNTPIIEEFRANQGKVGGPYAGKKMLLLHTTGRKSGNEHVVPVRYFDIDGQRIIAGSAAGATTDPQWYRNAVANPDVTIEIGEDTMPVHAEVIGEPARSAYWEEVVADDPGFGEYPKKTSRVIPLLALV